MGVSSRVAAELERRLPALRTGATTGDAHAAFADGLRVLRTLARSRSTRTDLVEVDGLGPAVRKEWRWRTAGERFKGALRTTLAARSPAAREWSALERSAALEDGTESPSPRPLLMVEERASGVLSRCVLLLEYVEGAEDLASFLLRARDAALRRDVLHHLARRLARLHDAGIVDRDFHPRNVLVVESVRRTFKIDSPKQSRGGAPLSTRRAAVDLGALDVGLERLATRRERGRFLATYRRARALPRDRELARHVDAARLAQAPREARRLPSTPA